MSPARWNDCSGDWKLKSFSAIRTLGEIVFEGQDITMLPAHARVALGITMVPEGRRLFRGMSVHENLLVGAHASEPAMLADRMGAYVHHDLPLHDALMSELELGQHALGEAVEGAREFSAGAGRHGEPR